MGLQKNKKDGQGIFDGIKSKLGFADSNANYYDQNYDNHNPDDGLNEFNDEYDEYREYGEYGLDYHQDEGFAGAASGSGYDPYVPVTTRPARSSALPKLVSIEDVRAHTQIPERLRRDPLPPRSVTPASSYRSDRTVVKPAAYASAKTPNARAYAAQNKERSESLNALFSPTVPAPADPEASSVPAAAPARPLSDFATKPASGPERFSSARPLSIVRPVTYNEAERIPAALKAGNVVVLALKDTPEGLAKRLLDFSFGVSSALDAVVECIANKVFVISCTGPLSDAERTSLHNQGVL